ncbi:MAG: hypothetical protein GY741_16930 [Phycisphaeraceae bacterium]|nr:hypothetical protein [Phycisphaeraceae bacterium]
MSFGRTSEADIRASSIRRVDGGAFAFLLESPFGAGEIRVSGLSETIVDNALAAAGGAFAAGADFASVAKGLDNHRGVPGRMQPHPLPNDVLLIDDSYNANPQSMRDALETLTRLETTGRRLAVLGQMGELGDRADEAHRDVGELVGSLGLDELFLIGPMASLVSEAARGAGLDEEQIHLAEDHESLAHTLRSKISAGDRILVKGSRAAKMERVIEALERGSR